MQNVPHPQGPDSEKTDADSVQPLRNVDRKAEIGSSGGDGRRKRTRNGTGNPGDKRSPRHSSVPPQFGSGGSGPGGTSANFTPWPDDEPKRVRIEQPLTVRELAETLRISDVAVIKHLFMKGVMRTVSQIVELDHARQLAIDLGYELIDSESPDVEG